MYFRIMLGVAAVGMLTFLMSPVGYGQFQGGGPGGPPGGFGGFGKGGGGKKQFGRPQDPNQKFDQYAQGRPFFLISEATPGTQAMLRKYAQDKGIQFGNDQVTRDQYLQFSQYVTEQFANPFRNFQQKGPGGQPPAGAPGSPTLEMLQQMADIEFKSHDANGDGKLNMDEMPGQLKRDLARWDTNKDGMIDQDEYRGFYIARMSRGSNGSAGMQSPGNLIESVLEEDLDKRPVVFRAGKLPAGGMPPWFTQLDTDADGQVALYEWRAGGRDLEEFGEWDRDNDGFITPEEALKVQAVLTGSPNPLLASNLAGSENGDSATNRGPGGARPGMNMPGMMMNFNFMKPGSGGGPPGMPGMKNKGGPGKKGGVPPAGGFPQFNNGSSDGAPPAWMNKGGGKGKGKKGGGGTGE
jgi:EF hand